MKTKIPYRKALDLSLELKSIFAPYCKRIEIAGSIRRECATVGDIEIVAIPVAHELKQTSFLDGDVDLTHFPIEAVWKAHPKITELNQGFKYKKLEYKNIQVDLFLQPNPETWGMNFMIRTGSAWFAKMMVTTENKGGFMPNNFIGGSLAFKKEGDNTIKLDTSEEEKVFELWGKPFIPPKYRKKDGFYKKKERWYYKRR